MLHSISQLGVRAHRVDAARRPCFCRKPAVTSIVDAIRALLSGQPVGSDIWGALAWCLGILLVAHVFAMRAYKKRV